MNKAMVFKSLAYIIQPISLALVALAMVFFSFSTFAVVSKEDTAQKEAKVYSINAFDSSDEYLESQVFQTLFKEYIFTVADYAKLEVESSINASSQNGLIDITQSNNNALDMEPLYYDIEELMKWGQYTELFESVYYDSIYDVITLFDKNIVDKYKQTVVVSNIPVKFNDEKNMYVALRGEYTIPIYQNTNNKILATDDEGKLNYPTDEEILYSIIYYSEVGKYYSELEDQMYQVDRPIFLLSERYVASNGISLVDRASSWHEYVILMENLINYIKYFGNNYNQFYDFINYSSNVDYYIMFTLDGKEYVYQNEDSKYIKDNPNNYHEFQDNYEKYFKFSFLDFEHKTNVRGIENDVFIQLNNMFYSEVEDMHIYIGISEGDMILPDQFLVTYQRFNNLKQNMWYYLGTMFVGVFIWVSCCIYLCGVTGRRKNGQFELYWIDKYPTEISILLVMSFVYAYGLLIYYNVLYVYDNIYVLSVTKPAWIFMDAIAQGIGISMTFTMCLYSLVRRIKGRNIWKNSISRYLIILLGKSIKGFLNLFARAHDYLLQNEGIFKKIMLPIIAVYILNCIAGIVLIGLLSSLGFLGQEKVYLDLYIYIVMGITLLIVAILDILILAKTMFDEEQQQKVMKSLNIIMHEDTEHIIDTSKLNGSNKMLAEAVNSMGNNVRVAVEKSTKNERFKSDLITNVSHDIKTPLTSIINYVDLIKRENIETEPVKSYVKVLESKTKRLKHLTEDLVEASKISSGNITLEKTKINLAQLTQQMIGEFEEKFASKNLEAISEFLVEDAYIYVDGRRMFRIMENVFQNIFKYALEGTRVYLTIAQEEENIKLMIKNISASPLNVNAEELMEQFIRGDVSRTTEGSGLGLFISKSLTTAQDGQFLLELDGDLFKVIILFPKYNEEKS